MAAIHWTPTALNQLAVICDYLAKDSPFFAEKLAVKIFEAAERLNVDARVGWMLSEFERDDIRELLVHSYRIVYRIKNEECYIVSILHGSRDIRKLIDPDQFD